MNGPWRQKTIGENGMSVENERLDEESEVGMLSVENIELIRVVNDYNTVENGLFTLNTLHNKFLVVTKW